MAESNWMEQALLDLQWMAARYANERSTFAPNNVNEITLKMIESGVYPSPDRTRDAPESTVWVKDGGFGWPTDLIEKHGWDGRKQRKETK